MAIQQLDLGRIMATAGAIKGQQQQDQLFELAMQDRATEAARQDELRALIPQVTGVDSFKPGGAGLRLLALDQQTGTALLDNWMKLDEATRTREADILRQRNEGVARLSAAFLANPTEQGYQAMLQQAQAMGADVSDAPGFEGAADYARQSLFEVADLDTIVSQALGGSDPLSPLGKIYADIGAGRIPADQADAAIAAALDSGETNVTVNNAGDAPQVGTIPQGYQLSKTPEGAWVMAPIPGGPVDAENVAAADAAANAEAMQQKYGNVVVEDVGRAIGRIEEAPWYASATGIGGLLQGYVPGSMATDVQSLLDSVKANIGFDRLQEMREASPTGGALGQVTERELAFLQSTLGNLERSQSEEQLLYNLNRLNDVYLDVVHGVGNRPGATGGAAGGDGAGDGAGGDATGVPAGVDPSLWEFMTPEERALWQN
jgi:hypothetical protein